VNGPEDSTPTVVVGLVRVREHCLFTWRATTREAEKRVTVEPEHCDACIADLPRLGYAVETEGKPRA